MNHALTGQLQMPIQAIVRPPGKTFAEGLSQSGLGTPDVAVALRQHDAYCNALESSGVILVRLPPDDRFPDSTFVEDTAVIIGSHVLLTRPGAESRQGEVASIRETLKGYSSTTIQRPGTLDGGDVCRAGDVLFVGLSNRTNRKGIEQLMQFATGHGLRTVVVDIQNSRGLLHLKSGVSSLGGNRLLLCEELAGRPEFNGFERVCVPEDETYAANSIPVGPHLLIPFGFPATERLLTHHGYRTIKLEMSEFRKMEGGLSCLSLRLDV